jgi:hypothetical protein
MRNSARTLEAVVAMRNPALAVSNCAPVLSNQAFAVSALRTGFARILRSVVRSMGAAHELALFETSIVGNFSPTLTRSES